MKVHLSYQEGDIPTQEKEEGTALHSELLAMQKTTMERIITNIKSGRLYGASFPLVAQITDVVVGGIPDLVVFEAARPKFIVELKTTSGRTDIVYDDQKAQASIYGLLLEQIGFDCTELKLVVVRYKRDALPTPEARRGFLKVLVPALMRGEERIIGEKSQGVVIPHLFKYDKYKATETIADKKGYWLGQREPKATTNPNKCRACPYRDACPERADL
jgi:hypothetical protein